MPEHDTYRVVERFARNSDSTANAIAFYALFRRTRIRIQGQLFMSILGLDREVDVDRAMHLLVTGRADDSKPAQHDKPAKDMTPEELKDYFIRGLQANGIPVDPGLFTGS